MDTDVNLCKIDDVPDGGKKHFEIMGYDILVVRLGDRFFCVDAACTYKWAMLTDGLVDREKLLITCKDCNGSWDLQTGQIGRAHVLNSSHGYISYAVFCLKKKKKKNTSRC